MDGARAIGFPGERSNHCEEQKNSPKIKIHPATVSSRIRERCQPYYRMARGQ
jgi:hypothetical protein